MQVTKIVRQTINRFMSDGRRVKMLEFPPECGGMLKIMLLYPEGEALISEEEARCIGSLIKAAVAGGEVDCPEVRLHQQV